MSHNISKADWWCWCGRFDTLTSAPTQEVWAKLNAPAKSAGALCQCRVLCGWCKISPAQQVALCCFLDFRMSSLWVSEFCSLVVTDPMTHSANSWLRRWTFSDAQPIDIYYIYALSCAGLWTVSFLSRATMEQSEHSHLTIFILEKTK